MYKDIIVVLGLKGYCVLTPVIIVIVTPEAWTLYAMLHIGVKLF